MAISKLHTIDKGFFLRWLNDEPERDFAYSKREAKKLVVIGNDKFKVMVANQAVWQGSDPEKAVEQYNAITKKYEDKGFQDFKL